MQTLWWWHMKKNCEIKTRSPTCKKKMIVIDMRLILFNYEGLDIYEAFFHNYHWDILIRNAKIYCEAAPNIILWVKNV